jgi:hypothetical protein
MQSYLKESRIPASYAHHPSATLPIEIPMSRSKTGTEVDRTSLPESVRYEKAGKDYDSWKSVDNRQKRRRIQNRLAQRRYRKLNPPLTLLCSTRLFLLPFIYTHRLYLDKSVDYIIPKLSFPDRSGLIPSTFLGRPSIQDDYISKSPSSQPTH